MSERDSVNNEGEFFDRIVGNPIHAYKMMKRFSVDLGKIEKDLKEDDWSGKKRERVFTFVRCCNLSEIIASIECTKEFSGR